MRPETLSILALLISSGSLLLGWRNYASNKNLKRAEKKTELTALIAECQSILMLNNSRVYRLGQKLEEAAYRDAFVPPLGWSAPYMVHIEKYTSLKIKSIDLSKGVSNKSSYIKIENMIGSVNKIKSEALHIIEDMDRMALLCWGDNKEVERVMREGTRSLLGDTATSSPNLSDNEGA